MMAMGITQNKLTKFKVYQYEQGKQPHQLGERRAQWPRQPYGNRIVSGTRKLKPRSS